MGSFWGLMMVWVHAKFFFLKVEFANSRLTKIVRMFDMIAIFLALGVLTICYKVGNTDVQVKTP